MTSVSSRFQSWKFTLGLSRPVITIANNIPASQINNFQPSFNLEYNFIIVVHTQSKKVFENNERILLVQNEISCIISPDKILSNFIS